MIKSWRLVGIWEFVVYDFDELHTVDDHFLFQGMDGWMDSTG